MRLLAGLGFVFALALSSLSGSILAGDSLGSWFSALKKSSTTPQFLPVDEAFGVRLTATKTGLIAHFDIKPGYYLYRDKLRFLIVDNPSLRLGEVTYPDSEIIEDDYFGAMAVYYDEAEILLALEWVEKSLDGSVMTADLTVEISFQGCAETGYCYPPVTRTLHISRIE